NLNLHFDKWSDLLNTLGGILNVESSAAHHKVRYTATDTWGISSHWDGFASRLQALDNTAHQLDKQAHDHVYQHNQTDLECISKLLGDAGDTAGQGTVLAVDESADLAQSAGQAGGGGGAGSGPLGGLIDLLD